MIHNTVRARGQGKKSLLAQGRPACSDRELPRIGALEGCGYGVYARGCRYGLSFPPGEPVATARASEAAREIGGWTAAN